MYEICVKQIKENLADFIQTKSSVAKIFTIVDIFVVVVIIVAVQYTGGLELTGKSNAHTHSVCAASLWLKRSVFHSHDVYNE